MVLSKNVKIDDDDVHTTCFPIELNSWSSYFLLSFLAVLGVSAASPVDVGLSEIVVGAFSQSN